MCLEIERYEIIKQQFELLKQRVYESNLGGLARTKIMSDLAKIEIILVAMHVLTTCKFKKDLRKNGNIDVLDA